MSIRHYAVIILVSFVVTFMLTPIVRKVSISRGLVDEPGERKVHDKPMSRLGGVAIFAGFIVAIALEALGERFLGWNGTIFDAGPEVVGVLAGMFVIFAVGLIDDLMTLSPGPKFVGQLTAAAVVIVSGLRIDFIGDPFGGGLIALGLLGIPITLIYIAGFTNVINLIDGLDGLAAGVTAIAAVTFLVIAAQGNRLEAAAFAAALIGACIAFLWYNFHPASIFMGDSGAMFLGFSLATISLLGVMKSVAAIALAVPLLIIGVPIFDTASAIVRRVRHKRPIQEADRGHIHHRLLGHGFDQRQTVLIIYVWSAALAVGGFAMRYAPQVIKIATFAVLAALTAFMAHWLGLFEAAHHHHDEEPDEGYDGELEGGVDGELREGARED